PVDQIVSIRLSSLCNNTNPGLMIDRGSHFLDTRVFLANRAGGESIMATTAGFKQQCPSCEAMVPIRDANLVGRKIDCPKCKYRFVVEDPGAETDTDEDEVAEPKKKRTRDERTSGKDSAASKRVMTREEMEEEEAERTKKGAPTKLIL